MEPVKGSLKSFFFILNKSGSEFSKWDLIVDPYKYEPKMSYFDIFVPTKESACYSWFATRFLKS